MEELENKLINKSNNIPKKLSVSEFKDKFDEIPIYSQEVSTIEDFIDTLKLELTFTSRLFKPVKLYLSLRSLDVFGGKEFKDEEMQSLINSLSEYLKYKS